ACSTPHYDLPLICAATWTATCVPRQTSAARCGPCPRHDPHPSAPLPLPAPHAVDPASRERLLCFSPACFSHSLYLFLNNKNTETLIITAVCFIRVSRCRKKREGSPKYSVSLTRAY
ncbi:HCMVUL81, partial [Human betaherpesvirus 5]|uniref:Uncharacterized protein UL81 n=1 Tax=Human cytomegalovirus (strain AD169) TaxID=10360 RepID=UL81_HCMVA